MESVCDRTIEEVHDIIGRYVYGRYHGKDRAVVRLKGMMLDGDPGPFPLYSDEGNRIGFRYAEPDILMLRDGQVRTVIQIDSILLAPQEYVGKAIMPIIAEKMVRGDDQLPIAVDVSVVQVVCYHGEHGDGGHELEMRLRRLSEDISMLFRNTGRGCRYSLVIPVKRSDDSIEEVLGRYLDDKIW